MHYSFMVTVIQTDFLVRSFCRLLESYEKKHLTENKCLTVSVFMFLCSHFQICLVKLFSLRSRKAVRSRPTRQTAHRCCCLSKYDGPVLSAVLLVKLTDWRKRFHLFMFWFPQISYLCSIWVGSRRRRNIHGRTWHAMLLCMTQLGIGSCIGSHGYFSKLFSYLQHWDNFL